MNSIQICAAKEEAEAYRNSISRTIINKINKTICTIAQAKMDAKTNTARRMKTQALKAYIGD
jgi:hypothetical protein